ncbi:MAG: hypothetical protein KDD02_23750 [Phaeodactylibacter sp.]|nr:hypothetical protein [Phaeodactylibacter sp.]MCB9299348.1 hypothetical protein [Lewinellaceae bacterium]
MKRILQLSLLLFVLLLAFQVDGFSQGKKKKSDTDKYFDESGNFASKLWYGGGFTLGFSGNNFESVFQFGLSPIVGYKITENFSVGPRASLVYIYYKAETGTIDGVESTNLLNYGIGAFARYKIARTIFAHVEYGFDNEVSTLGYNSISRKWEVNRRLNNNAYIGGGYNDGNGVWGYEIYLLYNLIQDDTSLNLPFDIRFGVTYNF